MTGMKDKKTNNKKKGNDILSNDERTAPGRADLMMMDVINQPLCNKPVMTAPRRII